MSDSDFFFPELPDSRLLKNLDIVRSMMAEHASYLIQSEYPGEAQRFLLKWFMNSSIVQDQKGREQSANLEEGQRFTDLVDELETLYGLLKSRKPAAGEDVIQYAKAASSMLDKITSLRAQAANIKLVSDFQNVVLQGLQDICTPAQREEFVKRIEQVATGVQMPANPTETDD
ncbi:hypothetical protein Lumi_006 [Xylophilus phage Lumi]|nr:hypothetical protein Lumi_006 [Xylophilus phage Lumi]